MARTFTFPAYQGTPGPGEAYRGISHEAIEEALGNLEKSGHAAAEVAYST